MAEKNKIEIINIDLGINIAEEIKNKVDSLNDDITLYTKNLIEKTAKKNKPTQKQLEEQAKNKRIEDSIEILESAFDEEDNWIKGRDLASRVGLDPTAQSVNKLSLQIRKRLKQQGKWVLIAARKKGKTSYRLARFK